MNTVRKAVVAGRFYPSDAVELDAEVRRYLDDAEQERSSAPPKALVAPHAGYAYSGPVAGSAFASLRGHASAIRRVVLVGPSHYFSFDGVAVCGATHYETPLGLIPVDTDSIRAIGGTPGILRHDLAHYQREHALETHLPFLQTTLESFSIIPLLVGTFPAQAMRNLLERLWGVQDTLVCISSDLSHYHPYREACKLDADTSAAIERLDSGPVTATRACGYVALRGLLECAQRKHMTAHTLDLRNSGDTAGPRDGVVGYGAYAFR